MELDKIDKASESLQECREAIVASDRLSNVVRGTLKEGFDSSLVGFRVIGFALGEKSGAFAMANARIVLERGIRFAWAATNKYGWKLLRAHSDREACEKLANRIVDATKNDPAARRRQSATIAKLRADAKWLAKFPRPMSAKNKPQNYMPSVEAMVENLELDPMIYALGYSFPSSLVHGQRTNFLNANVVRTVDTIAATGGVLVASAAYRAMRRKFKATEMQRFVLGPG